MSVKRNSVRCHLKQEAKRSRLCHFQKCHCKTTYSAQSWNVIMSNTRSWQDESSLESAWRVGDIDIDHLTRRRAFPLWLHFKATPSWSPMILLISWATSCSTLSFSWCLCQKKLWKVRRLIDLTASPQVKMLLHREIYKISQVLARSVVGLIVILSLESRPRKTARQAGNCGPWSKGEVCHSPLLRSSSFFSPTFRNRF